MSTALVAIPHRERTRIRQRLQNAPVVALLRSPLHPLLSRSLMLLTYRQRRSGRSHTIPVMYAEDGAALIVFVGHAEKKSWWRNLRDGAHVSVRLRGSDLLGRADLAENDTAQAVYLARFPTAAAAVSREPARVFVRISNLQPHRPKPSRRPTVNAEQERSDR